MLASTISLQPLLDSDMVRPFTLSEVRIAIDFVPGNRKAEIATTQIEARWPRSRRLIRGPAAVIPESPGLQPELGGPLEFQGQPRVFERTGGDRVEADRFTD